MNNSSPIIDKRSWNDIVDQAKALASIYTPGWIPKEGDPGLALIYLFSRLMEILIDRLNRVPEKNLLAFLDVAGVTPLASKAAMAPVKFILAAGVKEDGFVPQGTQLAASLPSGQEPVTFETQKALIVHRALLNNLFSHDPSTDSYTDQDAALKAYEENNASEFEAFTGKTLVPHRLYMAQDILFRIDRPATLKLTFYLEKAYGIKDFFEKKLAWYTWSSGREQPLVPSYTWSPGMDQPLVPGGGTGGPEEEQWVTAEFSSENVLKIESKTVNDIEAWWVWAQTKKALLPQESALNIKGIEVRSEASEILPDLAFFNTTALDILNDFYPFGERPKLGDTFYLACPEAFSKKGGKIIIQFKYRPGVAPGGIGLQWEFWDGEKWGLIYVTTQDGVDPAQGEYEFIDKTNAFSRIVLNGTGAVPADNNNGTGAVPADNNGAGAVPADYVTKNIEFKCPDIKTTKLQGKENSWIRVRIISGNYGEDAKLSIINDPPQTLADWKYSPESFEPPVISSVNISYIYEDARDLTSCLIYNNFGYNDCHQGILNKDEGILPFIPPPETEPALYLGFDIPFSNKPVSIFFAVSETAAGVNPMAIRDPYNGGNFKILGAGDTNQPPDTYFGMFEMATGEGPMIVWEYYNGSNWKHLGVEDATRNLTESGMVEFAGPEDLNKTGMFGRAYYWIRARLEKGDKAAIRILGIYNNTTWAKHSITINNEIIGSSSETPGAIFNLSRFPVLEGQKIEVREPEKPGKEALDLLIKEEGEDVVSPVNDVGTGSSECWVRWHEVDHFRFSGKKSRHYIIDRSSGEVTFGDGNRGMIPPAGRNNIRASFYQAGGGEKGNVSRNSITILKRAIPFIDSVFNVDEAGGGSKVETLEWVKARGPQAIKHKDRAVNWEDYEWLAKEASLQVARARCIQAKKKEQGGIIRLIIVPSSDDPMPFPSQGLIKQVRDYLETRRVKTAELDILTPNYQVVSVKADIFPERPEEADLVRRMLKERLEEFFHPLKGGPDGQGWEFGRYVYVSEVCRVIEDTEGVNHAENVALFMGPEIEDEAQGLQVIEVGEDYLVASGEHLVNINLTG